MSTPKKKNLRKNSSQRLPRFARPHLAAQCCVAPARTAVNRSRWVGLNPGRSILNMVRFSTQLFQQPRMAGFPDPRCVKLPSGLSKRRNAVGGLDLDTRQTPQSPVGFHRGDRIASCLAIWQHIGCIGAVLSEIESRLDQPIGNYFDLVAGTSTGGLIAAAVAKRYTRLNFELPDPSWSLDSVEHLPSLLHKGRTVAHDSLTQLLDRFFSSMSPDFVPFADRNRHASVANA